MEHAHRSEPHDAGADGTPASIDEQWQGLLAACAIATDELDGIVQWARGRVALVLADEALSRELAALIEPDIGRQASRPGEPDAIHEGIDAQRDARRDAGELDVQPPRGVTRSAPPPVNVSREASAPRATEGAVEALAPEVTEEIAIEDYVPERGAVMPASIEAGPELELNEEGVVLLDASELILDDDDLQIDEDEDPSDAAADERAATSPRERVDPTPSAGPSQGFGDEAADEAADRAAVEALGPRTRSVTPIFGHIRLDGDIPRLTRLAGDYGGTTIGLGKRSNIDLDGTYVMRCTSWANFVESYERDLRHGALCGTTDETPEAPSTVEIVVALPDESVPALRLTGEVVHVVPKALAERLGHPPGFAVQLVGMTPHRRSLLAEIATTARALAELRTSIDGARTNFEQIADSGRDEVTATVDVRELGTLDELRREFKRLSSLDPLARLGIASDEVLSRDRLSEALAEQARLWHPDVSDRFRSAEAKRLATQVFLLVEDGYQRAMTELGRPHAAPSSANVRAPTSARRPPAPPAQAPHARIERAQELTDLDPAAQKVAAAQSSSRPAWWPGRRPSAEPSRETGPSLSPGTGAPRGLVGRVSSRLMPSRPTPPRPHQASSERREREERALAQAVEALAQRRYDDAIKILEAAGASGEGRTKLDILLHLAMARRAVGSRDLPTAIAHYDRVLALDPEHPVAKRDLLMIHAAGSPGSSR